MRHNPYRYGDTEWKIGDKVISSVWINSGTVTNLTPTKDGKSFTIHVTWGNKTHISYPSDSGLIKKSNFQCTK